MKNPPQRAVFLFFLPNTKLTLYCGFSREEEQKLLHVRNVFVAFITVDCKCVGQKWQPTR
jgi:hypothetical protein